MLHSEEHPRLWRDAAFQLVAAILRGLLVLPGVVPRPLLIERLERKNAGRVISIVEPAGQGSGAVGPVGES